MNTTTTPVILTEDAFEARFAPQINHLDPHAGINGWLYETYGPELAYVQSADPACIWTMLDCDGELVLASGCSYVNRIGYVACKVPVPDGEYYEVPF